MNTNFHRKLVDNFPKSILSRFDLLGRTQKISLQIAIDCVLVVLCFILAMALRLENFQFIRTTPVWVSIALSIPLTISTFNFFDMYRSMVRYVTDKILVALLKSIFTITFILVLVDTIFDLEVPRSVFLIFPVLLLLSAAGFRFLVRALFRYYSRLASPRVLIFGAGAAGADLATALQSSNTYRLVGFIDDNPEIQGITVCGVKVHPPPTAKALVEKYAVEKLFLAIPSATQQQRSKVVNQLEALNIKIMTVPTVAEITSNTARISELRSISPKDLLDRDPVAPIESLLRANTHDKCVMVTGAGGSIGSEISRQVLTLKPKQLILFDISEFSLYKIEKELMQLKEQHNSSTQITTVLGSVQNQKIVEAALARFNVDTIYHAAAYKHVPLVEENIISAIMNNVFGTLFLATAARKHGVSRFILISSDKAVRPTNVMGATKRIAELICQALADEPHHTVFAMVRFGNVLGSSGSVIPSFQEQIEKGGPVTVTHSDINRFFMLIPEAAQLVIQAGAMAKGGDVYVLDMGKPVKILDLAFKMIRLNGLTPYLLKDESNAPKQGDIPVSITGLRKGEKLYEELLVKDDAAATQHPRILSASDAHFSHSDLIKILEHLETACETFDYTRIRDIFYELPLAYQPKSNRFADSLSVPYEDETL